MHKHKHKHNENMCEPGLHKHKRKDGYCAGAVHLSGIKDSITSIVLIFGFVLLYHFDKIVNPKANLISCQNNRTIISIIIRTCITYHSVILLTSFATSLQANAFLFLSLKSADFLSYKHG